MVAPVHSQRLRLRRKALLLPDQLVFPEGRKPGVKRDTKIAISDRCESISKAISLVDEKFWEKYCTSDAHLGKRDWVRYILDQDGIGSCAAESATGLLATMIWNDLGLDPPLFNPWFNYQLTSGGRDNGSVIGHNVEDLVKRGACPEEVRPRSLGWRAGPTREQLRVAKLFRLKRYFYIKNHAEFISALLQGFCIHFGIPGHAVVGAIYLGRGKILYPNTWGYEFGDKGFGVTTLDNVRYDYGAYGYETMETWDPDEWKPKHDQQELARAVNRFMDNVPPTRQRWSSRLEGVRRQEYKRAMRLCELTL